MLSMAAIGQHLGRLSYRPGWTLTAYEGRHEGHHLVITTVVEDSYHPGQTTTLDVHSALPPMESEQQLEAWLAWRLGRIENHEMREWFKRDGTPVYDPHGPDADQDVSAADPTAPDPAHAA